MKKTNKTNENITALEELSDTIVSMKLDEKIEKSENRLKELEEFTPKQKKINAFIKRMNGSR